MGFSLVSIGAALYWIFKARETALNQASGLPLFTAAIVLVWIGGFLFCYGIPASRAAVFPLIFLFLVVPPPPVVLEKLVVWLQKGSADVSYVLFKMAGVPVLRQGFTFSLPGLNIEVAEQCSGDPLEHFPIHRQHPGRSSRTSFSIEKDLSEPAHHSHRHR